jgi:hypothetical protein
VAEQALIAANRAKIEQLKTLPRGADELELGDLMSLPWQVLTGRMSYGEAIPNS